MTTHMLVHPVDGRQGSLQFRPRQVQRIVINVLFGRFKFLKQNADLSEVTEIQSVAIESSVEQSSESLWAPLLTHFPTQ